MSVGASVAGGATVRCRYIVSYTDVQVIYIRIAGYLVISSYILTSFPLFITVLKFVVKIFMRLRTGQMVVRRVRRGRKGFIYRFLDLAQMCRLQRCPPLSPSLVSSVVNLCVKEAI